MEKKRISKCGARLNSKEIQEIEEECWKDITENFDEAMTVMSEIEDLEIEVIKQTPQKSC